MSSTTSLGLRASIRVIAGVVVYGGLFFGTAGTFEFWEAWVFLGALSVLGAGALIVLVRADPELLERRMRMRERRPRQRVIMAIFTVTMLLVLGLPGLDHRFGWSDVPVWLVLVSLGSVLVSYFFVMRVLRENRYASRTIDVEEGQELVTDGLYGVVRHPMYLAMLPVILFTPLALGSWWALVPAVPAPFLLVLRILDEEEALREGFPGYADYMEATKSRLIPGVW